MTDHAGRFLWYELMTTDVQAAQAFYEELIGWKAEPWPDSDIGYVVFMNGERGVGGLMKLTEEARKTGAPPHWMGNVGVDNVDTTIEKAKAAGAKVLVAPQEIPKVGRFSVLQDPLGAVLTVFCPTDSMPGSEPQVGDFSWHELATSSPTTAWRFYDELFSWEQTQVVEMGEGGAYFVFMAGPYDGGGMYRMPTNVEGPPHWLYYIRVSDLDAAVERCQKMGGTLLNGPMEVPGGDRVAQCCDPQGAAFALHWKK